VRRVLSRELGRYDMQTIMVGDYAYVNHVSWFWASLSHYSLRKKAAAYVASDKILRMTEVLVEKGLLLVISNSLFSQERSRQLLADASFKITTRSYIMNAGTPFKSTPSNTWLHIRAIRTDESLLQQRHKASRWCFSCVGYEGIVLQNSSKVD
jgi:hypothetical protein